MKMSQTTRVLLLLVLIVAAVAVWYTLFFTGGQQQPEPATVTIPRRKTTTKVNASRPVAVTTSARALQVLPIPFLVTEAPEEAPLEANQQDKTTPALAEAAVPPNPFVPLRIKTAAPPRKPQEIPESKKPVLVTPQPDLTANIPVPKTITPNEGATAPPPVSLGQGALPIKLSPLAQEVSGVEPLQQAVAENNPPTAKEQGGGGTTAAKENPAPENGENKQKPANGEPAKPPQSPPPPPPPNPLAEWAAQEKLRLDGVALGPVGVAIFKTANGYLALPVGQTFPDKDVLVKTITAERVLLVDSSGNNTLTLELGGGE